MARGIATVVQCGEISTVYHSLEVFQSWFMHLSQSWTTWTITLLSRNNSRKETLLNATKRLRHTNHFTLSFRLHPCHHTFGAKCKSPHSTEKHGRKDVSFHKHSVPKECTSHANIFWKHSLLQGRSQKNWIMTEKISL